ncbi:hypothetical protein RHE_PF00535 (plasmid) [Rhizobium etli CFN 42]|uniref:Uncharacterized protein n=1 Tax=Rhizobium etli (strain ATCC 51251 / DSM 11541 / JCM 21823 / NBRC 15573 / CFN 42) TaxID=347834 RepID=Q2JYB2_RHIEC|nr:hypothetical protein RHE_PF00535 [Rhizobium etli CFN 42]
MLFRLHLTHSGLIPMGHRSIDREFDWGGRPLGPEAILMMWDLNTAQPEAATITDLRPRTRHVAWLSYIRMELTMATSFAAFCRNPMSGGRLSRQTATAALVAIEALPATGPS